MSGSSLSYRDLQSALRAIGVSQRGKKDQLIQRHKLALERLARGESPVQEGDEADSEEGGSDDGGRASNGSSYTQQQQQLQQQPDMVEEKPVTPSAPLANAAPESSSSSSPAAVAPAATSADVASTTAEAPNTGADNVTDADGDDTEDEKGEPSGKQEKRPSTGSSTVPTTTSAAHHSTTFGLARNFIQVATVVEVLCFLYLLLFKVQLSDSALNDQSVFRTVNTTLTEVFLFRVVESAQIADFWSYQLQYTLLFVALPSLIGLVFGKKAIRPTSVFGYCLARLVIFYLLNDFEVLAHGVLIFFPQKVFVVGSVTGILLAFWEHTA